LDPDLKFQKIFSENTDREKVKFRKQLLTYLFFLFISVLFWYLNALGKTYVTHLSYTVNYRNWPKGKVLISDESFTIDLQVRGNGFHLLRYKLLSFIKPITLDLDKYSSRIKQTRNPGKYFLPSQVIKDDINVLFFTIQVHKILPDTFFIGFTEVIDKKIAVKPNLDLEFEKPFMLKGPIHIIPDSILVSGPKAIIDTLKFITTKEIQIKGIKDKIITEAELNPIKRFIFPVKTVKIFIPAEKYTEVIYTIPIESENAPSGYEIKTFPAELNLSFDVALSDFDKMNAYMFRAIVDYKNILDSKPSKLKVVLSKSPTMVKNIKFNPKSVDYLVEKW
jgi:hypothetical protein